MKTTPRDEKTRKEAAARKLADLLMEYQGHVAQFMHDRLGGSGAEVLSQHAVMAHIVSKHIAELYPVGSPSAMAWGLLARKWKVTGRDQAILAEQAGVAAGQIALYSVNANADERSRYAR